MEKQKCYHLPGGMPDWDNNGDACMKWRRFGKYVVHVDTQNPKVQYFSLFWTLYNFQMHSSSLCVPHGLIIIYRWTINIYFFIITNV